MATAAANIESAYNSAAAKLAELYADPRPDYTLPGGVTLSWAKYRADLLEQMKGLREALLALQGPFTEITVAR